MDRFPADADSAPYRSAAKIAGLTIASRLAGLVRTLAAITVLGVSYLGNIYASTNAVPTLLFEIVAGGAMAAILVPSLSSAIARGDPEEVDRTASAFAVRALVLLTPVVLAALLLRSPIVEALTSQVDDPAIRMAQQELGEFLLLLFLPQIWVYGVGVVLTGILHAHNRFVGPAVAPLLSSIVVTLSYLIFALVEPGTTHGLEVSRRGQLVLGLGTTAGVVALSLSLLSPVRRLGLRWQPTLRIPEAARSGARKLLGSAIVAVGAQQVLLAVVVVVANSVEGGVVAYQLAFTLMLLPWAVLAIPIATAAFPGMTEAAIRNREEFAARCSEASRSVAVLIFGAAAILFAVASPLVRLMATLGITSQGSVALVNATVIAFAPGLVGYGGYAFLTRAAYALGDGRSPALAALAGFGVAITGGLVFSNLSEGTTLIAALAGSFSFGMAVGAGFLLVRLRRTAGAGAFRGVTGTCFRGSMAGVIAGGAGALLAGAISAEGAAIQLVSGVAGAVLAAALYLGTQYLMGDRQMASAVAALRGSR